MTYFPHLTHFLEWLSLRLIHNYIHDNNNVLFIVRFI